MSGLILPPHVVIHDEQPKYVCRVPAGDGRFCGQPFYEGEERAYQRHVSKCAEENAEYIAMYREQRQPASGEKSDMEQWVEDNRDLLIEGRKKL